MMNGRIFLIGEDVMRTLPRATALLLIGIMLTGCVANNTSTRSASNKPKDIGRVASNITGVDAEGKALQLSDYRGKVVLLDFWASW
jgi:cytochrome oxidase Cu insertion factor (SCO1/SenC/PrrC family)